MPRDATREMPHQIASSREYTVKPRFGVGCEQTRVVSESALSELTVESADHVVQPFVEGVCASVSFLVRDRDGITLAPGLQRIERLADGSLHYRGGAFPLRDDLRDRAVHIARRAIESVRGLGGYVGVDVILGRDEADDVAIEINPRLTMSYVALVRLCEGSLAEAMLGAGGALRWHDESLTFDAAGTIHMDAAGHGSAAR